MHGKADKRDPLDPPEMHSRHEKKDPVEVERRARQVRRQYIRAAVVLTLLVAAGLVFGERPSVVLTIPQRTASAHADGIATSSAQATGIARCETADVGTQTAVARSNTICQLPGSGNAATQTAYDICIQGYWPWGVPSHDGDDEDAHDARADQSDAYDDSYDAREDAWESGGWCDEHICR